jgi:hypothetical protein
MRQRRFEALVVSLVLTAFAVVLLAGHSRWAGRELVSVLPSHGLNTGDIWVLLAWAGGVAVTLRLGFGRADR